MRSLLLIGVILLPTACADAAVPDPDPGIVVLRGESSGGCARLGPNCVTIDVFGDGTVEAYRVGDDSPGPVDTGIIDRQLVIALHREVSATDLLALHRLLPEGECQGCIDGIDTSMSFPFTVDTAAAMPMVFSSVEVDLDRSEPLFAAAWAVYEAAQAAVDVPTIAR